MHEYAGYGNQEQIQVQDFYIATDKQPNESLIPTILHQDISCNPPDTKDKSMVLFDAPLNVDDS